MGAGGAIFGIYGALAAFPRRLAAREVERQGGVLRRGVTRRTTHVVFGRTLLEATGRSEIEARYDAAVAAGRQAIGETRFLRLLDIVPTPPATGIATSALLAQSCLEARTVALLALFDAFEHDAEPWSFRDVILAKKYSGLIAGGADWYAIARSVRRSGAIASLTALSLHVADQTIYARRDESLSELDGQSLLPFGPGEAPNLEEMFEAAEAAEAAGDHVAATEHYRRYLAADPEDCVAAFNLANSLRATGDFGEAALALARAIKLDPEFVEAWFNLAGLMADQGRPDAARAHLLRAIEIDPDYADAIYNLAALDYEAGRLAEARGWWRRYVELDSSSDWARTAMRGIQFVDLTIGARSGTR